MLRIQKVVEYKSPSGTALGWHVKDIRGKVVELARRGVCFERYPGMEQDEHGIWAAPSGALVAWFGDPDGNTLSLTQW